jgi:hypothetical protein
MLRCPSEEQHGPWALILDEERRQKAIERSMFLIFMGSLKSFDNGYKTVIKYDIRPCKNYNLFFIKQF